MTHKQMIETARVLRNAVCQRYEKDAPRTAGPSNYRVFVRYLISLDLEPDEICIGVVKTLLAVVEEATDIPRVNVVDPWWRIIDFANEYPHGRGCSCCADRRACYHCAGDLGDDGTCPWCEPGLEPVRENLHHSDGEYR